jgi:hypothetical protein
MRVFQKGAVSPTGFCVQKVREVTGDGGGAM